MPWNCLYTLKNALNAGFEWPKFKAFSSSIRQTRGVTQSTPHVKLGGREKARPKPGRNALNEMKSHATQVHGGIAGRVLAEDIIVSGQDGIEKNAHDGSHCQTGEGDVHGTHHEGDGTGSREGNAQGQGHDQGSNDDVAALGEVHLVFHHVAYADSRNHTIEDQGDTADGGCGHAVNKGRKLRAEGQDGSDAGSNADDLGIIDLRQGQNAGVFAVGGVGRSAEESSQGGGKTVTEQGAVQTRVFHEVDTDGGGDGADVADVLHHRGQGDRDR